MATTFEHWYGRVSNMGRNMHRSNAAEAVRAAHRKSLIAKSASKSIPLPLEIAAKVDESGSDAAAKKRAAIVHSIKCMKKAQCVKACSDLQLNTSGRVAELRDRLASHYEVDLTNDDDSAPEGPKHKAKWGTRRIPVNPIPFTNQDFNKESLSKHLPGFKDGIMPEPHQCYTFYHTQEMWDLGRRQTNKYPYFLAASQVRPPWLHPSMPWPPEWCKKPKKFTDELFKSCTMTQYILGLKRLKRTELRSMFSNDLLYHEAWLKKLLSRRDFESFQRQLHYEDSVDPCGKGYGQDYRPNSVPKVGLLLELARRRYLLIIVEDNMSYDEATAEYGGTMTFLKHLQSKYKPYDGVRIYCVNGSKTAYTNNFRVDLRDGVSIEDMMAETFAPFVDKGYCMWGDNAFVSVSMLRKCRQWKINFAGTTRTTFGFPSELIDESLDAGQWKWRMTSDGLFAAYWADVGFVKMMSNFHQPDEGLVYRRVSGMADRVERSAPLVGVEYNDKMGGTDLMDFMRGIYTTSRKSKKWWKCLYYWTLDTMMYNAFVLHKLCWSLLKPGRRYKWRYRKFIRAVCRHFIPGLDTEQRAVITPPVASKQHRGPKADDDDDVPYKGPRGETKRPPEWDPVCKGGDLVLNDEINKWGRVKRLQCKYCWNSQIKTERIRQDTAYRCEYCKVFLCVGCNVKYHRWIADGE